MNFRLEKKSTGPTLTKFFVRDSTNAIVGTINVANEQAADLQKHWRSPQATAPPAKAVDKAAAGKAAIVAALRKGPRLSKAALLRG
jgi:hypothetical protein